MSIGPTASKADRDDCSSDAILNCEQGITSNQWWKNLMDSVVNEPGNSARDLVEQNRSRDAERDAGRSATSVPGAQRDPITPDARGARAGSAPDALAAETPKLPLQINR
jgi:hypothetical protein